MRLAARALALALLTVTAPGALAKPKRLAAPKRLLHAHAHDVALNPASNAKLLTAATALGTLGGAHTFLTTVSGALEGGVVEGPLVLRGHGDPSLSTADVAELVERLVQKGVRAVKGGVVGDQGYFDESFVPPAFEQQEDEWAPFRANTAAVSLDENTMTLVIEAAEKGKPARVRVEPEGPREDRAHDGNSGDEEGGE